VAVAVACAPVSLQGNTSTPRFLVTPASIPSGFRSDPAGRRRLDELPWAPLRDAATDGPVRTLPHKNALSSCRQSIALPASSSEAGCKSLFEKWVGRRGWSGWWHDGVAMPRDRRYPSDLTDAQRELIEPLLPPVNTGGRPEKHPRRAIVDAILYVVRTGCSWRQLPVDFPPRQTVYWYYVRWEAQQVTERMLERLRGQVRTGQGRNEQPLAGVIDSQSIKGADTAGRGSRGFDAGKKINGRKRFIITNTLGLLIVVVVCAASVQDRDGARQALPGMYFACPGAVRVRRRRLRRPAAGLGCPHPAHHRANRAQNPQARRDSRSSPAGGRSQKRAQTV